MPRSRLIVQRAVRMVNGIPTPNVPNGMHVRPEASGMVSIWPSGLGSPNQFAHAFLLATASASPTDGTSALWVLFGPQAFLDAVAAVATRTWPSMVELRADATPAVVTLRNRIADDRPVNFDGTPINASDPIARLRRRPAGFLDDGGEG